MKKQLLFLSMLISLFSIGNAQIVFPDANFKNALLTHFPVIDTNGDGEISTMEAKLITRLHLEDKSISNTTGIEYFIELTHLNLKFNTISTIDITQNINLIDLDLSRNELIEIDVSKNVNLELIDLFGNRIRQIDVSKNVKLTSLELNANNISEINVQQNINLTYLSVINNRLTEIDVTRNILLDRLLIASNPIDGGFRELNLSNNINLTYLHISVLNTGSLDLSQHVNLTTLIINNTDIANLDLSNQANLRTFVLTDSNINTLDLRPCSLTRAYFNSNPNLETVLMTGQPLQFVSFFDEEVPNIRLFNCPKLEFICADEQYLNGIFLLLEAADQTDCELSTDCENTLNRIQGTVLFDTDNDGCGNSDDVPFIAGLLVNALSLTSGESSTVFPNDEGVYTLNISDDTYFIGPVLQNSNYFTFSTPIIPTPTPIPSGLASLTTDYCIQPLGNFNDLEITIIPTNRARPGFASTYQITYRNIGTTTQSGSVTLCYQEEVLNYVSSTPNINSNINGKLTWSFFNLAPMEAVKIPLELILNAPTDSPALNDGDFLNFIATVVGSTDLTPENNEVSFVQDIVNSFDPNDKTCLEGDILDPDDVGGYLHYLIRFENEGSAEAVNIRVLDVIDTNRLDIESFIPLESSHPYTTTISNENEIEFTFANINLPFDDANNDGYVAFKIKTKDNLIEGDEIVNSAAIYFDFNFPIITENEIVTVKREEINEGPEFSNYFILSPNPTTGLLNLNLIDNNISIDYILIYDLGGNLVGFFLSNTRTMNVSYLFPNTYVFKVFTNRGEFSTQFIKL